MYRPSQAILTVMLAVSAASAACLGPGSSDNTPTKNPDTVAPTIPSRFYSSLGDPAAYPIVSPEKASRLEMTGDGVRAARLVSNKSFDVKLSIHGSIDAASSIWALLVPEPGLKLSNPSCESVAEELKFWVPSPDPSSSTFASTQSWNGLGGAYYLFAQGDSEGRIQFDFGGDSPISIEGGKPPLSASTIRPPISFQPPTNHTFSAGFGTGIDALLFGTMVVSSPSVLTGALGYTVSLANRTCDGHSFTFVSPAVLRFEATLAVAFGTSSSATWDGFFDSPTNPSAQLNVSGILLVFDRGAFPSA